MYRPWATYIFLLQTSLAALAVPKNITIDDQNGDEVTKIAPSYFGQGGALWTQGNSCGACGADNVNASRTLDGTWHDATGNENEAVFLDVNFTGSAVYAFFILANSNLAPGITAQTSMTFEIDGNVVQNFTHTPTSATDYTYNASVFTNTSLVNTNHTVRISSTGSHDSLILFDYIVYTSDPDTVVTTTPPAFASTTATSATTSPTSSQPSNQKSPSGSSKVGPIVGAVVGVLAVLILAFVAFFLWRRSRQRNAQKTHIDIDMIDDGGNDGATVTQPGMSENLAPEPYVYTPLATTHPSVYSSEALTDSASPLSQHPPASSIALSSPNLLPSATTSSFAGGRVSSSGQRSTSDRDGDPSLRTQVELLMNQLADMRAQQLLGQQSADQSSFTGLPYEEDEAPPPDYMSDAERRSPEPDGGSTQRGQSIRRGGSRRVRDGDKRAYQ